MKYVENEEANKQINAVANLINKGLTDAQIAAKFEGKQKNLRSGDTHWFAEDINVIRVGFKLVGYKNRLFTKKIKCPNCGFTGWSKQKKNSDDPSHN